MGNSQLLNGYFLFNKEFDRMTFKRSFRLASFMLVLFLILSPLESPAQAADGGSTYEEYSTGSTFRTETISAGIGHVCAVESDGTLNCWGLNDEGQASPNSYSDVYTQIASGYQHTCAIRENGTVDCWGDNTDGKTSPPDDQAIYLQISAGENFTCGILEDSTLSCWGNDDYGQITDMPAGVFTQVNAGYRHACAIDTGGILTCWGDDASGQVSGVPSGIVYQVSGGNNHTCAILSDSTIECWGSDADGQSTPVTGSLYTQVSAGSTHTCAILASGYGVLSNLECWGDDTYAQVSDAPDENFTQVTSGTNFTCGIQSNGEVSCWGYGDDGQTALPMDLTSLGTAQLFVAGTASCLITTEGRVKCWGNPAYSAALLSETPATGTFIQVAGMYLSACGIKDDGSLICWGDLDVSSVGPYVQVSASDRHACAVDPFGGVDCWGANGSGESTPPAGVLFKQVAAGSYFTCGVKTDNTLQCWGTPYDNITNPPAGTYKQVSSGLHHSCAIAIDGSVQCWGYDGGYGGLVEPAGVFKQISSSNLHNCAIRSDNTVTCWGLDGMYPGNPELLANDPPAGEHFRQISDEGFNACGIKTNGTMTCWGQNNHGQAPEITIAPATLSRATEGYAYSQQLTISGGTAPYTISHISGTLPPGLSLSAAGLLSGTPGAGTGGNTYEFTVRARDSFDITSETVQTYSTRINRAPTGTSKTVHVNEDTPIDIVMDAADADGDLLAYSARSGTYYHCDHFTLLGVEHAIRYEPQLNWNGDTDFFEFFVNDGLVSTDWVRVNIIVDAVEDVPVAASQSTSTDEDTPIAITLGASDGDGDTLTWRVGDPTHGTLSGTAPNLTYTPDANWNGTDSFAFYVNDTKADSSPATVTIEVNPFNDAPAASDQSVTTDEDTAKAIVLGASDADGDALTWTIVASPTHGTLSGTAPNLTYTPGADWNGSDTFTFRVDDGLLFSDTATVTVTVSPVNDAPRPPAQGNATWQMNRPASLVIAPFTDVDSASLTYSARQQSGAALPAWLTFDAATRTFSGTPPFSAVGSYVLEVTASDGEKTGTLTFTLEVVKEIKVYLPFLTR